MAERFIKDIPGELIGQRVALRAEKSKAKVKPTPTLVKATEMFIEEILVPSLYLDEEGELNIGSTWLVRGSEEQGRFREIINGLSQIEISMMMRMGKSVTLRLAREA